MRKGVVPKGIVYRAQRLGQTIPYDYFVTMVNPKYQGTAWDWNNFVTLAVRMTNVTCYQAFSDKEWGKWEKEIRQIVTSTAKTYAEQIIKDSGVLEWGGNKRGSE
jgi:hypothetical protein